MISVGLGTSTLHDALDIRIIYECLHTHVMGHSLLVAFLFFKVDDIIVCCSRSTTSSDLRLADRSCLKQATSDENG